MLIYRAILNKKIYIGQTQKDLEERKKEHKRDSNKYDTYFYRSINKHGFERIKWEIIHDNILTKEDLDEMEIYYINIMNANDNKIGYNITPGGSGGDTISLNPNRKDIIKRVCESNGKVFTDLENDENDIINKYLNGDPIRHLSKEYNVSRNKIKSILVRKEITIRQSTGEDKIISFNKEINERIISLFNDGRSINYISKHMNITILLISRTLHDLDIRKSKRFITKRY